MSLPVHNTSPGVERPSSIKHFAVKSSDVLNQSMQITVEDDTGPLFYKTRELMEHEIVDSIMDSKTNQVRWTIHQPKRGWYIRLRSPMFPPGASINLIPLTTNRDEHGNIAHSNRSTEPKLSFGCQTIVPSPVLPINPIPDHCYPPSRTSTSSQTSIPTSSSVQPLQQVHEVPTTSQQESEPQEPESHEGQDITDRANHDEPIPSSPPPPFRATPQRQSLPMRQPPPPQQINWQVTHYSLQMGIPETGPLAGVHYHPHLANAPTHAPQTSFLSRALAPLANISHATSHHFTIQPLPLLPQPSSSSNAAATATAGNPMANANLNTDAPPTPTPNPFVAFTDSTPVLRATPSGTLSVDVDVVRSLGVEMAFWVAVSLAFLEFLRDRDGYLAASED